MFYTVYQITNLINEKIYIGVHKTNNVNDSYMGSGKRIKRSIKKYGKINFKKDILFIFDNKFQMLEKEFDLVNQEFVNNENTYNISLGGTHSGVYGKNGQMGYGGENLIDGDELKRRLVKDGKWEQHCQYLSFLGKKMYDNGFENGFLGKHHTEETKRKIGEINSKYQKGKGNSQYGTMWIYCPYTHINKKIPKSELPKWENDGWIKGRKII